MQRLPTVMLRKEEIKGRRVTSWRLVCSGCGPVEPPIRSKAMLVQVAEEHAEKIHSHEHVQLLP